MVHILQETYDEAITYLQNVQNDLNNKIESLENPTEIDISLLIPDDTELNSLLNSIKTVPYNERNNILRNYKSKYNSTINDEGDKYYTMSNTNRMDQIKKLKIRSNKLETIKSNPRSIINFVNHLKKHETKQNNK